MRDEAFTARIRAPLHLETGSEEPECCALTTAYAA
jgi:hypothetical protein